MDRLLQLFLVSSALAGCGKSWDVTLDAPEALELSCVDPQPIGSTGYERCRNGAINRVGSASWEGDTPSISPCQGDEKLTDCSVDSDCTEGASGLCASEYYNDGDDRRCVCKYSCETDADCESGYVCLGSGIVSKNDDWATCVRAHCETGDDCDSGQCGLSAYYDVCRWQTTLHCRTGDDTCVTDDDCSSDAYCAHLGEGQYSCVATACDLDH